MTFFLKGLHYNVMFWFIFRLWRSTRITVNEGRCRIWLFLKIWIQDTSGYAIVCIQFLRFSNYDIIITARVAKRAKVMFSQACVTHSVQQGGGRWATPKVITPSPPPPPGTRWQHLPPLPGTRWQHLPSSPRTRWQHLPPSPGTRWQHLPPPPGTRWQYLPPLQDHVTTPPPTHPPGTMRRWTVCILLECILVHR